MKARSYIMQAFREYFFAQGYTEVTPPTLVQTQVSDAPTGRVVSRSDSNLVCGKLRGIWRD